MGSFYDRIRSNLGYDVAVEPVPEPGLLQQWQTELGEATRLSTQQRIAGFGACVVFTAVFWALGSFSLMSVNLSSFIFMFTLGNISALVGTCFLVGPKAQFMNMTTKERLGSAAAFVFAMIATLAASLHFKGFLSVIMIVVPCMIIQMIALIWYCSTYVPGGQGLIMRLIGRASVDTTGV
eukprot:jgi/Ulvmu1/8412/UM042_0119.1